MRLSSTIVAALLLLGVAPPIAAQTPLRSWAAARYELSLFREDASMLSEATETWHYTSLEAGARRDRLTTIGRFNFASRYGNEGLQIEADLYPVLPVGYAFLSAAWSPASPFPELRFAGELFAALPAGFEASAGVVYMDFDDDDVTIWVGSLAKYVGKYWIALRPSYSSGPNEGSVTLMARRYLDSDSDFVSLRAMYGATPGEIEVVGSDGIETIGASVDAQLELSRRWALLPAVGIVRDDLGDIERLRVSLGFGGMYRF